MRLFWGYGKIWQKTNSGVCKSFLLQIDSLCILDDLTDEQSGQLFNAIYQYQLGNEIELPPLIRIAFSQFKNQFNRDEEKYQKTCEARKEAGSKGGNHRHDGENLQPLHTNDGIIKKVGRRTNVWDVACGSMNSKDKISFKHPATFPKISKRSHSELD